ncbi:hypothetical protein DDB_G0283235 [Dictyostelium discoideum AX4]|uniref:Transmembrane protein n=1 Tax=Dictyostelium discoideum TaxID=44689 RepID=Q54RG1_DICDI|nr:hypothetical protein DDB_G0283235 [Dictyostelium discoideum AX4]EAL65856.1 hypothetical protein DDB_G0283235 [Dictyostelium discoideum AX4]|eukprot:XP_639184.1 hypothetical protein DDB_G0283235 [Dictyostelium discoideum AX4]
MKFIFLILFLFNIFLVVSSQYDVFELQAKNCENGILKVYDELFKISFFTDYSCQNQGYYENTNYPFIVNFNCYDGYNNQVIDGEITCSTLISKYYSFKFVKGPCVDDKIVTIGKCSSVCGTNIKINYDPFQNYTITTYPSKDCTGIASTESYGSIDCKDALYSKTKNILF